MDFSANPNESPPSYAEHASRTDVPYGQSRLLYGDENAAVLQKDQPRQDVSPNVPYAPADPSPYANPPGYAPYGAPPFGHPMGPGYPPPGYAAVVPPVASPQQQQQSVVVVTEQRRHHPILIGHVQSYAGHIVMACFVMFCCCFIFGIIAFILASKTRQQ